MDEIHAYRVSIIEDHPVMAMALQTFFSDQDDLTVVGQASDVESGLTLIRNEQPQVAVIDLILGNDLAFDLIREIHTQHPLVQIVVYTAMEELTYVERCLQVGAKGFVSKSQPLADLLSAVRLAAKNKSYLDQNRFTELLSRNLADGGSSIDSQVSKLSPSEMRVFHFIGNGSSSAEIAKMLHRSVNTIETYRTRIKNKLGLKHACELAHFAFQHAFAAQGLVSYGGRRREAQHSNTTHQEV